MSIQTNSWFNSCATNNIVTQSKTKNQTQKVMHSKNIKQTKPKCEFQEIGFSIKLYLDFLESGSDPSDKKFKRAVGLWKQKCRQITISAGN
jgi:hypothetical protein